MTDDKKSAYLDAQQVVFLPFWARLIIIAILGALAFGATVSGFVFLFADGLQDWVVPVLAVAQTAAGAFAIVLFVLFAEKQLSTPRLMEKTDQFLDIYLLKCLARIEIPSVEKNKTVTVSVLPRVDGIYGKRKDIYGANYEISLAAFKMRMWVGINVRRISTIYFVQVESREDIETIKSIFKFTFAGAHKVGYDTHFEYCEMDGERFVSIWSTVHAEQGIPGQPSEQLFWVQDIAMMTQSVARTAWRHQLSLFTETEPGPL